MENISPVKSNTLQCTNKIVIYSQVNGLVFYMFQFTKIKKCHKLKAINITVFKKNYYLCRQHERCEKHCLTRNFAVFQIYNKTKAT